MAVESRLPKISAIATGVIAILCAAFGLLYNAQSFVVAITGGFAEVIEQYDMAHFYPAFYVMSAICIVFYGLLFWCGVQFVRLRLGWAYVFTALLLVEVLYFLSIGFFGWHLDVVGMSVAGASGVGNGGLVVQFVILLPLWGPIAVIWAKRRIVPEVRATSKGRGSALES